VVRGDPDRQCLGVQQGEQVTLVRLAQVYILALISLPMPLRHRKAASASGAATNQRTAFDASLVKVALTKP
jgi:hypothetical protein